MLVRNIRQPGRGGPVGATDEPIVVVHEDRDSGFECDVRPY